MRRTRHILAVALVATALCADRAVAAAPTSRPQVGDVARQVVTRLTVSFRRVVPAVRLQEVRQEGPAIRMARPCVLPAAPALHPTSLCLSESRLPPPLA